MNRDGGSTLATVDLELLPWHKQRGESAKSFAAFAAYRDLGPQRSLTKVERLQHESGTGTSPRSQLGEWSARWSWVERADAFDREQDRRQREEHNHAIADARRSQTMAGTLLLGAALRRIAGDANTRENEAVVIQPLDLNEIGANEVVRLAEVGAKLQDRGLGIMPDLHGAASVSGRAVYDLSRKILVLAMESLEDGMRTAAGANGNLEELIALQQEKLIEDTGTLYRRTTS